MRARRLVPGLFTLYVGACALAPVRAPASNCPVEVTGRVEMVGAGPDVRVVLAGNEEDTVRTLTGEVAASVAAADGLDVRVRGEQPCTGGPVTVESYEVVAWEGRPTLDGTLAEVGGVLQLVPTRGGEAVALPTAPASLHEAVGRRVWVAVAPNGRIDAFGFLSRPEQSSPQFPAVPVPRPGL